MSAFTPDQTNTLRELGLCSVPTARGNICDHAPFEDYPACWNHIPRWIAASFANRRAFVTSRAMRVGRVWSAMCGCVVVDIHKKCGEPIEPGGKPWHVQGFTSMWLAPDEATVLADLLSGLGNVRAAELILGHVEVLAKRANPRTLP